MRKGLRPGPYHLGHETQSDLPVLVFPENEEYVSVVVGRFPTTKKYDAYAHAVAYTALPELLDALRRAIVFQEKLAMREQWMNQLGTDLAEEVTDIVLQGREALRKAEKD